MERNGMKKMMVQGIAGVLMAVCGTAQANLISNGSFDAGILTANEGRYEPVTGTGSKIAPWVCASGKAGLTTANGLWVKEGLNVGKHALYLQTFNYPADSYGASGDTSVWQAFDVSERGDYRLGFDYTGRPGMFGAETRLRLYKGEGTQGVKVWERTVTATTAAAFIRYEAFLEITEPGRYTLQFFQEQEAGFRMDKTIVIDEVVFVRDPLYSAVKAEQAGIAHSEYDVAAYVWPAYQPDPRWAELGIFKAGIGEWQNVKEAVPKWPGHNQPRVPAWGYENETDPQVMAKKIDAAVSHGVNVFIYDWYWYGGHPFLERAVHDGFLGASNNGKMRFFFMWANHHFNRICDNTVADKQPGHPIWLGWVDAEMFRAMSNRLIDMYFSRPNYYRIGGKPVFMIYEVGTFVQGLGGVENAAESLRRFREACERAGLGGIHLMACDYGLDPGHIAKLDIDSATMYNFIHWSGLKGLQEDYSDWAERSLARFDVAERSLGLKAYFAHASIGWDTNPRYPATCVMPTAVNATPVAFARILRRAKAWCDTHTPKGYPKLISINAWNEWIEGSYLEPDERFGMGYLETVRNLFMDKSTEK